MLNKLVGYQHASPGPFWAVEVRESVEKQNNNKKKFHASVDLVIGGGTNTFIAHSDIPQYITLSLILCVCSGLNFCFCESQITTQKGLHTFNTLNALKRNQTLNLAENPSDL